MAIVLLYSFRIVLARRDLPFPFDKSRNLLSSIVIIFKTIIFDKFIFYYCFLNVFYWISIKFLSFTIEFLKYFYRILSNSIKLYSFRTKRYHRGILQLSNQILLQKFTIPYPVDRRQTGNRHYRLPLMFCLMIIKSFLNRTVLSRTNMNIF